jgi:hyperosmotically inducible protein
MQTMTKTVRHSGVAATLLSITTLVMPAAHAETAGQFLDDTTLVAKTKAALVDEKGVPAGEINVEAYKGVVQLSGFVEDAKVQSLAMKTARKVEGSRNVLDAMVVMSGSRTPGQVVDDTGIQTQLKVKLAKAEGLGQAVGIVTSVRMGQVLLAGFAPNAGAKTKADSVARGIQGVTKVHDRISVSP